jgi:molybdate transport system substrate-binding protein
VNTPGLKTRVTAIISLVIAFSGTGWAQTIGKTELTVFAAASLTEAFQSLGKKFEAKHPETSIRFNFGGSQQLVQQMVHGARADVLAAANMKQMNVAIKSGVIDTSLVRTFARNRLVVILPKENSARIRSLQELTKPGIKIVLADSSVPAGQYALQVLDRCSSAEVFGIAFKRGVLRNVVSYEENVRAVLSKVQMDECDAGIVYSSDVCRDSLQRIQTIDIPEAMNSIAEYPAAVARESIVRHTAREFVEYLLSGEGQHLLQGFGFIGAPTPHK